jgi:hypothetical protein
MELTENFTNFTASSIESTEQEWRGIALDDGTHQNVYYLNFSEMINIFAILPEGWIVLGLPWH